MELMSVIQYLSGQLSNTTQSTYKDDVRKYFLSHRNHEAVQKIFLFNNVYPDLTEIGFLFYNFPSIKLLTPPDSLHWHKYFSKNELTEYLNLCMKFYKDTKFHSFYTAHTNDYESWSASFRKQIEDPVRVFNTVMLSDKNINWYICLDPLNDWGAHTYTDKVNPALKNSIVYQQGYFGAKDSLNQMVFKTNTYDIAWHEGTHAISDAILKHYKPQIDSLSGLMQKEEVLKRQNITDWQRYFNELVARSVSIALHKKYREAAQYDRLLKTETSRGFIHAKDVSEVIYINYVNGGSHTRFEDVFPKIFSALKQKYQ